MTNLPVVLQLLEVLLKYEKKGFLKRKVRKHQRVVAKCFMIFFLKKLGVSINLKYKSSVYETENCNSHDITE